ncbi:hypothetical protein B0T14DRAFT_196437 [Immersiella caudata]|uniref:Uncharacterized protein n=1 Tax=Immersiella caudata TaxID=314043 RepID=A0AA40C466_9PEZI|nr:hypothetical protein B0T14DRAFT_196437 [Immersiella caudata]
MRCKCNRKPALPPQQLAVDLRPAWRVRCVLCHHFLVVFENLRGAPVSLERGGMRAAITAIKRARVIADLGRSLSEATRACCHLSPLRCVRTQSIAGSIAKLCVQIRRCPVPWLLPVGREGSERLEENKLSVFFSCRQAPVPTPSRCPAGGVQQAHQDRAPFHRPEIGQIYQYFHRDFAPNHQPLKNVKCIHCARDASGNSLLVSVSNSVSLRCQYRPLIPQHAAERWRSKRDEEGDGPGRILALRNAQTIGLFSRRARHLRNFTSWRCVLARG